MMHAMQCLLLRDPQCDGNLEVDVGRFGYCLVRGFLLFSFFMIVRGDARTLRSSRAGASRPTFITDRM